MSIHALFMINALSHHRFFPVFYLDPLDSRFDFDPWFEFSWKDKLSLSQ